MRPSICRILTAAVMLLLFMAAASSANAQQTSGFKLHKVEVGTGIGSVQLPPITLGGYLPPDYLNADMISTFTADGIWRRVRRRSALVGGLSGLYTNRVRFSNISSLGGTGSLNASRLFGRSWRPSIGFTSSVSNSDQTQFQHTSGQELVGGMNSVGDLSYAMTRVHSRAPDPATAALFVPIQQSVIASGEAYGLRLMNNAVSGGLSFTPSPRFSAYGDAYVARIRSIGSSHEQGVVFAFPDSSSRVLAGGVSYSLTRRSVLTTSYSDAKSTGAYNSRSQSAQIIVGWTGRRWVSETGIGLTVLRAGLIRAQTAEGLTRGDKIDAIYRLRLGYMSGSQAFYGGFIRSPNDSQGFGSLRGPVLSWLASWYWNPPRKKWNMSLNFESFRTPGNFLYIYTWHGNADFYRQMRPSVRWYTEVNFDRHGSKGFEGFHLMRENVLFGISWMPGARDANRR